MTTLYLVRHGENVANLTKEFSHRAVDYSLTDKGRAQAAQTADFFRGHAIDAVYSSPLRRARETAEAIAAVVGKPVTVVEDFREINVGVLEGQAPAPNSGTDTTNSCWRGLPATTTAPSKGANRTTTCGGGRRPVMPRCSPRCRRDGR